MLTPVEESEPGTPTEIDTLVTRKDRQNFTVLAMSRPLGVGNGIFLYRVMYLDGNSFKGGMSSWTALTWRIVMKTAF